MFFVTFTVTSRCNAACTHCSTSCGPTKTESLSAEKIMSMMDEAAVLAGGQTPEFCLTGGEPFLDFALLVRVVRHAKSIGADIACVTNASWASSDDRARKLIAELKDAGLALLCVSSSRFHEEFVKRSRVERALRVAAEFGLRTHVKFVRACSDEDETSIRAWAKEAGAGELQIIPLYPTIRENAVVSHDEYDRTVESPGGPCPAAVLNVHEDGNTYMCCTPGSANAFFRLGNVHASPLRKLHDRFELGGIPQILRKHGPGWFVPEIRERGLGHRLRMSYIDVCDLCTHIAHDGEMAAVARESARTFELHQLRDILARAFAAEEASPTTSTQGGCAWTSTNVTR